MLRTIVQPWVRDVDPERWDALSGDPFSSHATLAALEAAGLPGVRTWYAVVEDGAGRWLAGAPLARVAVDAGRLTHGLFRGAIAGARRVRPGFLHTTLMLCGTPLSVGNPPVRLAPETDPRAALGTLAGVLRELADSEGAAWRAFKEFSPGGLDGARAALEPAGWIVAPSETNRVVDIRWRDYSAYLAELRSPYRYKVRKAARALEAAGVKVDDVPLTAAYDAEAHKLYEAVVDRAAVQLERLTPEFFRAFGRAHGDAARMLRFRRGGQVIGWVALLHAGDTVHDMFHGIDYAENEPCALYFNQLAATVRLAIERGAARLSLGQSTETAKARFGARPDPRWIAVRHRSAAVTALLRAGRSQLFPAPEPPERRVFTEPAARAEEGSPCASWS
jgi:predicted N-acyltransferase